MPQLNPMPWFFTLCASWLLLLILIKMMINLCMLTMPNKQHTSHQSIPWTWL